MSEQATVSEVITGVRLASSGSSARQRWCARCTIHIEYSLPVQNYDRLGWLLQSILKPLLTKVDEHITNTKQLIAKFQAQPHAFFKDKISISFYVCSLYTNIGVEEAIDTCLQYTQRYDLECYSLEPTDIKLLLSLLLNNNVFKYQSTICHQIRGLAMGNRLSGTLAIIVMDRFERSHVYQQLQPASQLFIRYVDDSNTVANNTQQAQDMLRINNMLLVESKSWCQIWLISLLALRRITHVVSGVKIMVSDNGLESVKYWY